MSALSVGHPLQLLYSRGGRDIVLRVNGGRRVVSCFWRLQAVVGFIVVATTSTQRHSSVHQKELAI